MLFIYISFKWTLIIKTSETYTDQTLTFVYIFSFFLLDNTNTNKAMNFIFFNYCKFFSNFTQILYPYLHQYSKIQSTMQSSRTRYKVIILCYHYSCNKAKLIVKSQTTQPYFSSNTTHS